MCGGSSRSTRSSGPAGGGCLRIRYRGPPTMRRRSSGCTAGGNGSTRGSPRTGRATSRGRPRLRWPGTRPQARSARNPARIRPRRLPFPGGLERLGGRHVHVEERPEAPGPAREPGGGPDHRHRGAPARHLAHPRPGRAGRRRWHPGGVSPDERQLRDDARAAGRASARLSAPHQPVRHIFRPDPLAASPIGHTRKSIRYLYLIRYFARFLACDTVSCSKNNPLFERMSAMAALPNSADPGWDDDLAWLDRDPVTPEELEAALDRLCELDEPDPEYEEEYGDHDELTAEELAEIREAAADEVVAVAAAMTGRR